MSKNTAPDEVDRLLRRALDPDPAAVVRALEVALRPPPARRSVGLRWWITLATAAGALALIALVLRERATPEPAPAPALTTEVLTIDNENGRVTVTTPDGARLVVARRSRP